MPEGHVHDVGIQGIQFRAERLVVGRLGIAHRGGALGSKRLVAAVGIGQLCHTFRQPQSGKVRGAVALGQDFKEQKFKSLWCRATLSLLLSTDMAASYKIGLTNSVYKKCGQGFHISDYRPLNMFSEQQ